MVRPGYELWCSTFSYGKQKGKALLPGQGSQISSLTLKRENVQDIEKVESEDVVSTLDDKRRQENAVERDIEKVESEDVVSTLDDKRRQENAVERGIEKVESEDVASTMDDKRRQENAVER
ncbi:hypothetical protein NDU88_008268 [Pleurodeles waltl]|uniref:Uncharacterized protein n=1 Tax=Pleurodeles waltl TaxID=8319 RepID=A0AAV7RWD9_PLEWA|nr:hypothetical protein NDU88_008268 [Pleurodeles waltl]